MTAGEAARHCGDARFLFPWWQEGLQNWANISRISCRPRRTSRHERGDNRKLMPNIFDRIQRSYDRLSGARRRLTRYIVDEWEEAAFLSASKLGEAAGVSETVVIRLASFLGYSGYPEMQAELQEAVKRRLESVMVRRLESTAAPVDPSELVRLVVARDENSVRRVLEENSMEALTEGARVILRARTVYVVGMRVSAGPARILSLNLGQALHDVRQVTLDVGTMIDQLRGAGPQSLLITISFARYSPFTVQAAQFARGVGCPHLAITDDRLSPTARLADYTLVAPSHAHAFGHSHVATVVLINILLSLVSHLGKRRVKRSLAELEELLAAHSPGVVGTDGQDLRENTWAKGR